MPCSCPFLRGGLGERAHPELRRAVHPEQGEALVAGDGAGADDLAAGALLDHLPSGLGVAQEDAASVDGVHLVVLLGGDVEQGLGLGDAGVGDEHVE